MKSSKIDWKLVTDQQERVILHGRGPLRVLAAAGSGKTTTLTNRVVQLIDSGLARPDQLLVLTFTIKATADMQEKIARALHDVTAVRVKIINYHKFGFEVVAEYAHLLGYPPRVRIMEGAFGPYTVLQHLDEIYLDGLDYRDGPKAAREIWDLYVDNRFRANRTPELERLVAFLEPIFRRQGLVAVHELIPLTVELLRGHPEVLERYRHRFPFILVDEYQDTDPAQAEMVALLAGSEANVTIVGDDDQAIYQFRGAVSANILQFHRVFPGTTDVVLDYNFRSTPAILRAANELIRHNQQRFPKELKSGRPDSAFPEDRTPELIEASQGYPEEAILVDLVRALVKEGRSYRDIAVLARTNRVKESMFDALQEDGIPATMVGARSLLHSLAVRQVTAALRWLVRKNDYRSAVEVLISPRIGCTEADIAELAAHFGQPPTLAGLLVHRADGELGEKLAQLRQGLEAIYAAELNGGLSAALATAISFFAPGYPAADRANLEALRAVADAFLADRGQQLSPAEEIDGFLGYLEIIQTMAEEPEAVQIDDERESVKVLTAHTAKGLEFPVVIIAGLNAFRPGKDDDQNGKAEEGEEGSGESSLEEERRLLYVAMTRARERLYLLHSEHKQKKTPFREEITPWVTVQSTYEPAADPAREAVRVAAGFCRNAQLDQQMAEGGLEQVQCTWSALAGSHQVLDAELWPQALEIYQATLADRRPRLEQAIFQAVRKPHQPAGPGIFSYTHLSLYHQCPLAYWLTYHVGLPRRPGNSSLWGQVVHQLVAADRPLDRDELQAAYRQRALLLEEEAELPDFADELGGIEEAAANIRRSRFAVPTTYVEQEFLLPIGSYLVRGFIDRIQPAGDGEWEVVDFKTHRRLWSQAETEANAQLPIYVLACRQVLGLSVRRATLFFARHNCERTVTFNDQQLADWEERLATDLKHLTSGGYPPTPGQACQWCGYREVCDHCQR